jgi:1-aminocyclopropane-1-carboxylate deaminase/D-cysteine desulfhydrase-like pyridoxal-dependent ACC family enzyme
MDIPRLAFGTYPTPVERVETLSTRSTNLWIKRDDLTSDLYGGNKVRKLEPVLAEAKRAGATRLLTFGAAGSHHVLATAIFGRAAGFEVDAVIFPQPASRHARENLRADLAQGLHTHVVGSPYAAPLALAASWQRGSFFVAGGGSSLAGTLGYVDAARELAAQVRAGQMPEPDEIVVALGSGGTAAGLCVGLELEEMRTRVVGICVVDPPWPFVRYARLLARRAASACGRARSRADLDARLLVETGYLGRGYGYATDAGARAIERAREAGIVLDPTYTAKAFAAALDRVGRGGAKTILYWHTLSSAPMGLLLQNAPETLDAEHARMFR